MVCDGLRWFGIASECEGLGYRREAGGKDGALQGRIARWRAKIQGNGVGTVKPLSGR